ncbi:PP-loop domain-containing protein, partial [mine drainage metagenome]
MRCGRCDGPAVVDQPYRGEHVCATHLIDSVDERVRRAFHRQLPKFARGTVAVALSGGKDSSAALYVTHRYFARRPTVRVVAV